uniref:Uncharacterized protein n=1 Tax=Tanacetum cinerariifolium TaxID=118510 RepID=A0A699L8X0_TANCI|nr:hypothetical protein [Tanacetum cinerariifolium]
MVSSMDQALRKMLHCANLGFVYPKITLRERATFNMNRTDVDEGDEVQEVCPIHTICTDQSKRKRKAKTSSASSTTSFDVESLAKLMVNEYAFVSDM